MRWICFRNTTSADPLVVPALRMLSNLTPPPGEIYEGWLACDSAKSEIRKPWCECAKVNAPPRDRGPSMKQPLRQNTVGFLERVIWPVDLCCLGPSDVIPNASVAEAGKGGMSASGLDGCGGASEQRDRGFNPERIIWA